MSGKDAIQLQLMYSEFCPELSVGYCQNQDPYLMAMKCDGHGDCSFFQALGSLPKKHFSNFQKFQKHIICYIYFGFFFLKKKNYFDFFL